MKEQFNTALGFYRPSFFKMQVECAENLENLNELQDIPSAIYLHEYIHFLQDITTTYGCTNISTVVDFIKYVNEASRGGISRTLTIPVTPIPSPDNEVYFNLELKKTYYGSGKDVKIARVSNVAKRTKVITLRNGNENLDYVVISYTDENDKFCYHEFGSHCVIESMAYIIENSIYPNCLPQASDFPYKSAQKIIESEYIEFLENPLNALALCDASLGTFNPGEFFFSMLLKMKNEGYLPPTPEDVYSFCASRITFNFNGVTTLNQLLLSTSNSAIYQLCDYFTAPVFGDNKIWINYTISTAVNIRMTNSFFILQIARGGKIQTNLAFIEVFRKVGTPMISNQNDEVTFYSPLQNTHVIKAEYLWAINQIYRLYTSNTKRCELKSWCSESCISQNIDDFTDSNCYNSPWLRTTNPVGLCPFAVMWKTWGMENETPV